MAEKMAKEKINFDSEQPIFSWQAPEHAQGELDMRKITLVGVAAIAIIGLFIWQKQWSGIAVVVVAYIVLLIMAKTKPHDVKCAIYHSGVVIDDKVYSYSQFKSFWLFAAERMKIRFQLSGSFAGQVTMPLDDAEDPEQIKLFLTKYLPEEEDRGQDLNDMINHWLRF